MLMQLLPPTSTASPPVNRPLAKPHHPARCERCTTGSLFLDDDTEGGNALPAEWVCLQCGWRRRVRRALLNQAAPAA